MTSFSLVLLDDIEAYTAHHRSADAPAARLYVMIVTQPLMQIHKDCYVLLTTSPMRAVALRNIQRRAESSNENMSISYKAAYLYPVFVAGPFFNLEAAIDFGDRLVVGKRGLVSKVRHGCDMAARLGLECYMSDQSVPDEELGAHTADWPEAYRATLERVKQASSVLANYVTHDSLEAAESHDPLARQWLEMVLFPNMARSVSNPLIMRAIESAREFWRKTKLLENIEACVYSTSAAAVTLGLSPLDDKFAERYESIARFLRRHRHRRNELLAIGRLFQDALRQKQE